MPEICEPQLLIPEIRKCTPVSDASVPDWTKRNETQPFLNPQNCEYSITVNKLNNNIDDPSLGTSQFESIGSDFNTRMQQYISYGVDRLIEYYQKTNFDDGWDIREGYMERAWELLFERETASPGSSYYIPKGPGRKMKVLVTIPANYEVDGVERGFSFAPQAEYTPSYGENTLSVTYDLRLIRTKIEFVAKIIKNHYGDRHGAPFSNIRDLDLKKEANKLRTFVTSLNTLMYENDINIALNAVPPDRTGSIKFIYSTTYELLDILYITSSEERYLRVAFESFRLPRNLSKTTLALTYWVEQELFFFFNNHRNPTWVDFVKKYIYPPKKISMTIGSDFSFKLPFGSSTIGPDQGADIQGVSAAMENAGQVLKWSTFALGVINGNESLLPYADQAIKSYSQANWEEQTILNETFQSNLLNHTNNIVRFTDSPIDHAEIIDRFGDNLEALYENFVSQVDWKYLTAKSAECFGMDPAIMDPTVQSLLAAAYFLLIELPDMKLSTIDFPSSGPDWGLAFLDILEEGADYIASFIVELINTWIASKILDLQEKFLESCKEDFNYDSIDLNSLLADSLNNESYDAIAKNIGDGTGDSSLLRQLMRDVSVVLNMNEMCSLLHGNASNEVLEVVEGIIDTEQYIPFQSRFETTSDILGFFSSLGDTANLSFCNSAAMSIGSQICVDGFAEEIRRSLLEQKEDISSEEIENQITQERQKREALLQDLTEFITSTEDTYASKLKDAFDVIATPAIAENPSIVMAVDEMVGTSFYGPLTLAASEALGVRETPFISIIKPAVLPLSFPIISTAPFTIWTGLPNRGIIKFLTDENINDSIRDIYRTVFDSIDFGVDIDDFRQTWLAYVGMLSGFVLPDTALGDLSPDLFWKYYSQYNTWGEGASPPGASPTGDWQETAYESSKDLSIPSWWDVPRSEVAIGIEEIFEMPQIRFPIIFRDPFVGVSDPFSMTDLVTIQETFEEDAFAELPVRFLGTTYYEFSTQSITIDVFSNPPKAVEEGLLTTFEDVDTLEWYAHWYQFSKQQHSFVLLLYKILIGVDPARTGVAFDVEPGEEPADGDSEMEEVLGDSDQIETFIDYGALASSYGSVFASVLKTLYLFISDSEFLRGEEFDAKLKYSLKNKFKEQVTDLGAIQKIKDLISAGVVSSMTNPEQYLEENSNTLSEASLTYLIRMYILETYLKNIYLVATKPEKRIAGVDIIEHGDETLSLRDMLDSTLVSYIYELIKFGTERLENTCQTYYDIARRVADEELEKESPADGFLSISTEDSDILAIYDPAGVLGMGTSDDELNNSALKYFVAKDLIDFTDIFQSFVKDLYTEVNDDSERSVSLSFLDKIPSVAGLNLVSLDPELPQHGEQFYLEYYFRNMATGEGPARFQVFFANELSGYLSFLPLEDLVVGVRLCLKPTPGFLIFDPVTSPSGAPGDTIEVLNAALNRLGEFESETGISYEIQDIEQSFTPEKGMPIVNYEIPWNDFYNEMPSSLGSPTPSEEWLADVSNVQSIFTTPKTRDFLKQGLTQEPDFRALFEYTFPLKKMLSLLFIMNSQSYASIINNVEYAGTLFPSSIDPEQFIDTKINIIKMIENVKNLDNYSYTNSEVSEAGGTADFMLNYIMEDADSL